MASGVPRGAFLAPPRTAGRLEADPVPPHDDRLFPAVARHAAEVRQGRADGSQPRSLRSIEFAHSAALRTDSSPLIRSCRNPLCGDRGHGKPLGPSHGARRRHGPGRLAASRVRPVYLSHAKAEAAIRRRDRGQADRPSLRRGFRSQEGREGLRKRPGARGRCRSWRRSVDLRGRTTGGGVGELSLALGRTPRPAGPTSTQWQALMPAPAPAPGSVGGGCS